MIFLVFIFGLIIGSFLNAVIYRLHKGKTIVNDRSICPHCKHVLGVWDLIPVPKFHFFVGEMPLLPQKKFPGSIQW
jgi:leader peptidase (prepilin peptidase)/N-methyltransferase